VSVGDSASGATERFANFYRAESQQLVRFLMHVGATNEDAYDAAQEAFIAAWKNWDDIESPRAWIRTVAYRALSRRLRIVEKEESASDYDAVIQDVAEQSFHSQEVVRLIEALPRNQRATLALLAAEFSVREISEILGISPATVRVHIHRGRARLRCLMDDGGEYAARLLGETQ